MAEKKKNQIKLIIIATAVMLALSFAFLYQAHHKATALMRKQFLGQQMIATKQTALGINQAIQGIVSDLSQAASIPAVKNLNLEEAKKFLNSLFEHVSEKSVNDIGILDDKGIAVLPLKASHIKNKDFSFREYFKAVKKMKSPSVAFELIEFKGVDKGKKGIILAAPLFSESSEIRGVLVFTVKVAEFLRQYAPSSVDNDVRYAVYDAQSRVLFHPQLEEGTDISRIEKADNSLAASLHIVAQGKLSEFEYSSPKGERMLAAAHPVEVAGQSWIIVFSTPEAGLTQVLTKYNALYAMGGGFFLLSLISCAAAFVLMLKRSNTMLQAEISERIKTERRLRKREWQLTNAQRIARLTSWEKTFDSNESVWTRDLESIFTAESADASEGELSSLSNRIFPEDLGRIKQTVNNALESKKPFDVDYRLHRKDNSVAFMSASGEFVFNIEQNNSFTLIGATLDITKLKLAEEEINHEREQLLSIFDSIDEIVYVADPDTYEILFVNKALGDFFGNIIGQKCHVAFQNLESPCSFCTNDQIFGENAGKTHVWEFRNNKNNRWYKCIDRAIRWPNKKLVRYEMAIDITQVREIEAAQINAEKLESLGVLAGGIAHDFNNLLMAILGTVSLAKFYMESNSNAYEILVQAETAVHRAKDLTRQLLTFSKGGAPIINHVSIRGLIEESTNFVLTGSNAAPVFSLPDDLWSIAGDENQISQVINNLALNAQQAMPQGGCIHVSARNIKPNEAPSNLKDGRYIEIVFKDSGAGIDPENLKHIFDPYFTTKEEGSGLGLATSHSIIKRHGGCILVNSELGGGTVFTIYLPALQKAEEIQGKKKRELHHGKGKILIVDDVVQIGEVLEKMLESLGYETETATSGTEAINRFAACHKNSPFDAVILDLTIPGDIGGKEVLDELLKIDPEVTAIVSSGYSNNPILADPRGYGFKGMAVKPYDLEILSALLTELLSSEKKQHVHPAPRAI